MDGAPYARSRSDSPGDAGRRLSSRSFDATTRRLTGRRSLRDRRRRIRGSHSSRKHRRRWSASRRHGTLRVRPGRQHPTQVLSQELPRYSLQPESRAVPLVRHPGDPQRRSSQREFHHHLGASAPNAGHRATPEFARERQSSAGYERHCTRVQVPQADAAQRAGSPHTGGPSSMGRSIEVSRVQRHLVWIWSIGFFACFSVMVALTVCGTREGNVQEAWSWFMPTILPTLTVAISAAISQTRAADRRRVSSFLGSFARLASSVYLLLVLLNLLVWPLTGKGPLTWFKTSALWLGALQGILGGVLAMFLAGQRDP